MAQPGWYPDPEGRPGHARYWDGQGWQGPASPQGALTGKKKRPRWGLWLSLVLVVALVAGGTWVALNWGPWQSAQPTTSSSSWTDSPGPPPTPSPSPSSSPSASSMRPDQIYCPTVTATSAPQTDDSLLLGGGLTLPKPGDAKSTYTVSKVLTDEVTVGFPYDDTSWMSFVSLGLAPATTGFTDPATAASQIIECHLIRGNFNGYEGHATLESQPITIDGAQGHWVRIHALNARAPGGGATFDAIALDTGNAEGLSIYWAGFIDADENAITRLDAFKDDLRRQ